MMRDPQPGEGESEIVPNGGKDGIGGVTGGSLKIAAAEMGTAARSTSWRSALANCSELALDRVYQATHPLRRRHPAIGLIERSQPRLAARFR
jgi:hypothetical protein